MKRLANIIERIRTIKNWWSFVYPFNHVGSKKRIAHLRSGAKVWIRDPFAGDFAALLEVASRDVYRLGDVTSAKTIVDVGANIGVFTVLAARKFPEATVHAVEPESANFATLLENIQLNNLSNVVPHKNAVSKEKGTVRLYLGAPDAHSLYGTGPYEEVESISLSAFDPIDFLKLDAEGVERDILPHPAKVIAVEVHGDDPEMFVKSLGRPYRETHKHVYLIS